MQEREGEKAHIVSIMSRLVVAAVLAEVWQESIPVLKKSCLVSV